MVNEPSEFEPLKFYSIYIYWQSILQKLGIFNSHVGLELRICQDVHSCFSVVLTSLDAVKFSARNFSKRMRNVSFFCDKNRFKVRHMMLPD